MVNVLMRVLDAAFGHPRGVAGRIGGALMVRGNAEQERWAVQHADAVISVNNVMLWDRATGLAEVRHVLRPGGQLVITVHRHVLDFGSEQLRHDAQAAGFIDISLNERKRRLNSPAVELLARRGDT
jgi:SAM-dependent methyltransferase